MNNKLTAGAGIRSNTLRKLPRHQGKHYIDHSDQRSIVTSTSRLHLGSKFFFTSVSIGLRCKDGVVLAIEKVQTSKLLVKGANKRILSVDNHIGLVSGRAMSAIH
jgi:hypothetical protein